jgi:hypothetical protein
MTRRRIVMGKEAKIYEKLNVEKLKSRILELFLQKMHYKM